MPYDVGPQISGISNKGATTYIFRVYFFNEKVKKKKKKKKTATEVLSNSAGKISTCTSLIMTLPFLTIMS